MLHVYPVAGGHTIAKALGTIAAVTGIALPAVAWAAPVYLVCTIPPGGEGKQLNFSLDEQMGQVGISLPHNGRSVRLPAVYGPEEVAFRDGSIAYTVSRTDLTFVRTVTRFGWVDKGSCTLQKAPDRAF